MATRVKSFLAALFAIAQIAAVPAIAAEPEHGSEDDAQEMVRQAVDLLKTQGPARAYEVFPNRPGSTFRDRDLYIVVFDFNGTCLAHGANPNMVGKLMAGASDLEGQRTLQGEITLVKSNGAGWYGPYTTPSTAGGKAGLNKSYCKRGAGDTVVCAGVHAGQ